MEPADFLALVQQDPLAAAEHLTEAAQTLQDFAEDLRAATQDHPGHTPAGMGDRIRAHVISPTGQIKQTIDTGAA